MYQEAQSEDEDAEIIVKIFVQFNKSSGIETRSTFSTSSFVKPVLSLSIVTFRSLYNVHLTLIPPRTCRMRSGDKWSERPVVRRSDNPGAAVRGATLSAWRSVRLNILSDELSFRDIYWVKCVISRWHSEGRALVIKIYRFMKYILSGSALYLTVYWNLLLEYIRCFIIRPGTCVLNVFLSRFRILI